MPPPDPSRKDHLPIVIVDGKGTAAAILTFLCKAEANHSAWRAHASIAVSRTVGTAFPFHGNTSPPRFRDEGVGTSRKFVNT